MRPRAAIRWVTLVVAVMACSLSWMAPAATAAISDIGLVDGPDRFLLDASDDGRFVLTGTHFGPHRIVDHATGEIIPLPPEADWSFVLSGDGRRAFFTSDVTLTSDDLDGGEDVFSYEWATGIYRLWSPGWPGWNFLMDPANGPLGDADRTGATVAFTGTRPGLEYSPFVSDGTTVSRIGTTVNRPDGGAWDISGDGRFVLFNKQSDIYVEDRADPTAVPVQVDAALPLAATIDAAELSADGHHVIFVSDSPTSGNGLPRRTSVFHLDTGITEDIREFSNANKPFTGVGISSDGTSLSLMLDVPTETEFGLENAPGMFVWRNGAVTELSAPNGARPNGAVTDGFLTADGTAVVFGSRAENLVSGTTTQYNVYIRKLGVSPSPLPPAPGGERPLDVPAAFTAAAAARMLDTRTGAMPPAGTTLVLPTAGHFGIPVDATAVAVQVTATDGTGVGFVGVVPSGGTPGTTSNLNVDVRGETIANLAIVPIGSDGSIMVHTSLPTHLIVDLLGWWRPAGPVAAGRYQSAQPARVLDTRPESRIGYEGGKPAASSTTIVQITGRNNVPSSGVSAVIVNITLAEGEAPGFVQAAAADALVPGATSTLNIAAANRTAAAVSIVPVDGSGRIAIYSQPSTHLIVDVLGWLTDETAAVSTSGRFVPATTVTRLLDTRAATRVGWAGSKPAGTTTLVMSTTRAALVGNLTITETDAAGFVQLGPAASLTPGATSSVNASGIGETVANAFISDTKGGLGLYTMMSTHLVIDISGYMTS